MLSRTTIKLFNNTIYGVITSKFFRINNLVVANQVTARARNNVWFFYIPLDFLQSVTHGGMFDAKKVNRLKNEINYFRKPGFDLLSDLEAISKNNSVEKVELLDATWTDKKTSNYIGNKSELELRTLVFKHCNKFWENYNYKIDFDVELKMEHIAKICSYYSKAYYFFVTIDNIQKFRTRGIMDSNKNTDNQVQNHTTLPQHTLLIKLAEGRENNYLPLSRSYERNVHVSSLDYLLGKKRDLNFNLLPGDFKSVTRIFKLGILQFPCDTLREHNRLLSFQRKNISFEDICPDIKQSLNDYTKAA